MQAFVVGDPDTVTGFGLVGIKGVVVSSVDEAWRALSKAVESVDFAIIIISEEFSIKMRDKIESLRLSRIAPLILEIPRKLERPEAIDTPDLVRSAIDVKV
jgi:V/A-type H+-transporting ATPase subunit F